MGRRFLRCAGGTAPPGARHPCRTAMVPPLPPFLPVHCVERDSEPMMKQRCRYTGLGQGRDDGREAGEYSPIFFLTTKYRCVERYSSPSFSLHARPAFVFSYLGDDPADNSGCRRRPVSLGPSPGTALVRTQAHLLIAATRPYRGPVHRLPSVHLGSFRSGGTGGQRSLSLLLQHSPRPRERLGPGTLLSRSAGPFRCHTF